MPFESAKKLVAALGEDVSKNAFLRERQSMDEYYRLRMDHMMVLEQRANLLEGERRGESDEYACRLTRGRSAAGQVPNGNLAGTASGGC